MNDQGPHTARQSAEQAIHSGITDGELAALGRSPEVKVRAAVGAHLKTPLITLLKLAQDPHVDVRVAVASNRRPGIPPELHEDLAKDKDVDVVFELIANPAVSEALITRLGRHLHREYARLARARAAAVKAGESWPPHRPGAAAPVVIEPTPPLPSVPAFAPAPVSTPQAGLVDLGGRADRERSSALDALVSDRVRGLAD